MLDTAVCQARDYDIDTLIFHPALWSLLLALSPPVPSLSLQCDYVFPGARPRPRWAKHHLSDLSMTELCSMRNMAIISATCTQVSPGRPDN